MCFHCKLIFHIAVVKSKYNFSFLSEYKDWASIELEGLFVISVLELPSFIAYAVLQISMYFCTMKTTALIEGI